MVVHFAVTGRAVESNLGSQSKFWVGVTVEFMNKSEMQLGLKQF